MTSLTYKQGWTTIGDLTYTYDAAGNRIKTGGSFARSGLPPALTTTSYNANNQQTTFGTNTLTYGLDGSLATVTDAGVTTTYTGTSGIGSLGSASRASPQALPMTVSEDERARRCKAQRPILCMTGSIRYRKRRGRR